MNYQWYPGHMTKAKRMMQENIKLIDLIIELVDARIPMSSRNPDIDELGKGKSRIILLNKSDLADAGLNQEWESFFKEKGYFVQQLNAKTGAGIKNIQALVQESCKEKIERDRKRGIINRPVRAMVVGIPNVGKSTLINQISGRKGAKAENRPGVTRGKQWVTVDAGLQLLDTPGILWPKFEDPEVGMMLAFTGAVKEGVIDVEELACRLMELLLEYYPETLKERYKVEAPKGTRGYELLEMAGKNRGYLLARGEIHTERMAKVLLDEFRSGKLGKFTLEQPKEAEL